jgi:hypothetical protein
MSTITPVLKGTDGDGTFAMVGSVVGYVPFWWNLSRIATTPHLRSTLDL